MPAPSAKRWPNLLLAWNAYGHSIKWEQLTDIKVGSHGFVALAWTKGEPKDHVNYATLSLVDGKWEMQNDGHEPVTLAKWRRMRVAAECDWLTEAS